MSYNPLNLGPPLGSHEQLSSTVPPSEPSPAAQIEPSTEPSTTTSTTTDPPPQLSHVRTAPTTVPISRAAHQPNQHRDSDEESSTPTLHSGAIGNTAVPLNVGGLHGQPMPGSKALDGNELDEKDHQAGTVGGDTGHKYAEMAAADLGLQKTESPDGFSEKQQYRSPHHLGEQHRQAGAKVQRTASGTYVTQREKDSSGQNPVAAYGMVPVTRQMSQPPAVSPWGGVAPSGIDAEEGLTAVRSREEEEERELEREAKGPDPFAVKFEPGEKANPKNWSVGYRWWLTALAGLFVLNSTFASSSPSGIATDLERYFGISQEVATLCIALFVAGYCVGPLLWGPLSESYGRRPILILSFFIYTGMQVGCALSKNTASILVFRFLGGTFASAPLTASGAIIADIWDGDHRGQAMSLFALAPFAGPSIGPIVAGFISVSGTDWRWVFWILTIFAGVCLALIVFCVPETYAPALLVQKAKRVRKETGESKYYAPLELASHRFADRVRDIVYKPFKMLALEPMLLAVTIYMSFVYGIVYLLFESYPLCFIGVYGFNAGENGLAFLGFFLGGFSCVVFFMTIVEPRFLRHAAKLNPLPPKPEKRLELCVVSGCCLVVAMFWQGWTCRASIHWMSPILAGTLLGFAVLGMFVSLFNYVIDVYLWAAASALAGMTVMRSLFGAAFPLFATQMYEKLGIAWASSLLGFLALLMAPIPMLLMYFGPSLRARSQFSPNKVKH